MKPLHLSHRTLAVALASAAAALSGAQTLYAGPGWDQNSGIGYRQPYLSTRPGTTAGLGYGIGSVYQATPSGFIGTRALRWDANGYTILGGLGQTSAGVAAGSAIATNAAGTIVGSAGKYDAAGTDLGGRAVRWDAGGTTATELGVLGTSSTGYTISAANAINAGGTIVGSANKYVNGTLMGNNAVRWDAGSNVATELSNLGGTNSSGTNTSEAIGVNDAGTAFGWSQKFTSTHVNLGGLAVRWDAGSTVGTELGNLGTDANGVTDSRAYGIDSKGDIVGYALKYDGGTAVGNHAVVWKAGGTVATDLGTLGSSTSGASGSTAVAINDKGMVAGYSTKYVNGVSQGNRAVRWLADGTIQELGILSVATYGTTSTSAAAMNADGIVVGVNSGPNTRTDTDDRAVMWGLDGTAVDLNTLLPTNSGWLLTSAVAISDSGLITGIGYYDPDGSGPLGSYTRAYALQLNLNPTPEPATWAALGLGALAVLRRRRRP